jgi:LPPG:FO 2-phospho-L-lactate transferase
VKHALGLSPEAETREKHQVTAVVNTADDVWLHGLRICPDLDTCMYTLGGGIDQERGWGLLDETWSVSAELAAYDAEPNWFGLGDKDIATHLIRSRMLRAGYPLSEVTEALCARWNPGIRLLPMTDDRVETHVVVDDPEDQTRRKALHFQEWWVRYQAKLQPHSIIPVGAEESSPAPGVLDAITEADVILVAPSNPVVSIGTVLSVPGIREAISKARGGVIGLSPIVGAKPVRGMADICLSAIGVETSAAAVGRHYGSRQLSDNGILDGWLVHTGEQVDIPGVAVRAIPLLMSDVDTTADMVRAACDLAGIGL